jgi:hypothetical protein
MSRRAAVLRELNQAVEACFWSPLLLQEAHGFESL